MGLPVAPFAGEIYGPDAILMKGLTGLNWKLADYEGRGGYQACSVPQCGQSTEVDTAAVKA